MTDSIYALIGKNVRHRRLELHMTSPQISSMLGISRNDYLAMEEGTKHIAAPLLFDLAQILDVRAKYFFEVRDIETGQQGSAMAKMYELLVSIEE